MAALPDGYRIIDSPPAVDAYLRLRRDSGLTPRSHAEAVVALPGSWAGVHVRHEATERTVGMGRVIGDGGWYFHIVDMAVLPDHQRRGLGDAILSRLLEEIERVSPNAFVNLLADPPGRRLYARHGFVETAPASIGMMLEARPG